MIMSVTRSKLQCLTKQMLSYGKGETRISGGWPTAYDKIYGPFSPLGMLFDILPDSESNVYMKINLDRQKGTSCAETRTFRPNHSDPTMQPLLVNSGKRGHIILMYKEQGRISVFDSLGDKYSHIYKHVQDAFPDHELEITTFRLQPREELLCQWYTFIYGYTRYTNRWDHKQTCEYLQIHQENGSIHQLISDWMVKLYYICGTLNHNKEK